MNKTILFDLDDTLLSNPMEKFLPEYLGLLAKHLKDYYSPEKLPELIIQSTNHMVKNLDPELTLETVFDQNFYSNLKNNKEQLIQVIDDFYENIFPILQPFTKPIHGIPELIHYLKNENNNSIVISTNPLFPIKAIYHRLVWAGIPHNRFNFDKVTAFEEFHFAKPHPEYIAEILAQIGWPDGLVLMVGNDWEMDILPAEKLGIPTYFLGTPPPDKKISQHPLSKSGNHQGIKFWIDSFPADSGSFECVYTSEAYLAILKSIPAALDTMLKNVTIQKAKFKKLNSEWSVIEILSHLLDVDLEVNIPRIQSIKNNQEPFFSAVITDEWAETKNYQSYPFKETLNKYIQSRKVLLKEIESLKKDDWEKTVMHTIFGPTSVLEIIKFIAQHDRIHIQQIFKTLNE